MFGKRADTVFFDDLCISYYEKILRYCFLKLHDESTARDCTQDVFLVALEKIVILRQHPNPGGFLFQIAKNLIKARHRENLQKMLMEIEIDDNATGGITDLFQSLEDAADEQIDEADYVGHVLSKLNDEKQQLYNLYYIEKKSMKEIAILLGAEEPATRMRYVRLRREIRAIVSDIVKQYFVS